MLKWYPKRVSDKRKFTEEQILKVLRLPQYATKAWRPLEVKREILRRVSPNQAQNALLDSISQALVTMVNASKFPPGRWGGCYIERTGSGFYVLRRNIQHVLPEKPEPKKDERRCPFSPPFPGVPALQCSDCRLAEKIDTDPETRDTYYICVFRTIARELNIIKGYGREIIGALAKSKILR